MDRGGVAIDFCSQCRGLFCTRGGLDALVGRPVPSEAIEPSESAFDCPDCEVPMGARTSGEQYWYGCTGCDGSWLEADVLPQLERRARAPVAAGVASVAPPSSSEPMPVLEDRLGFGHPLVQLLAYPIVGLLGAVLALFHLAEVVVYFFRLWVHELGHAMPAWLSGRAALPLPIGMTFWREESSWFTALCLFFLITVFAIASFRERRVFGMVLAGVLYALQLVCTLIVPDETMLGWIVAGGLTGELVLSTALIVAFYYPLPDRLRWDFWRFWVLVPMACAFVGSFAMWVRIDLGIQDLPFGSIVGAPGDGSGDVERLLRGHGWTPKSMTIFFRSLASVCLAVIVGHYGLFGVRAFFQHRAGSRSALPSGE